MPALKRIGHAVVMLVVAGLVQPAVGRDVTRGQMVRTAVIGSVDERLTGAGSGTDGLAVIARRHLARTLRVSFPLRGSLAVTGTPLCFSDVVLTVAHAVRANGDATADPRGLRVAIPKLDDPGAFSESIAVRDYMMSGPTRTFDPSVNRPVAEDFVLLQLAGSLPDHIAPLALPRSAASTARNQSGMPDCPVPTTNAAYHDDLGFRNGMVTRAPSLSGPARLRNAGLVPLLTFSDGLLPPTENPDLFDDWYRGEFVALTRHDTATSASGSAIVCPFDHDPRRRETPEPRDMLLGIIVGETRVRGSHRESSRDDPMRNIANVNLPGIYRSLAALKGMSLQTLVAACTLP